MPLSIGNPYRIRLEFTTAFSGICNNSNLQYFLSITNEYFGNEDKFAKVIHSYKDDDENEYFFISGKKFYTVKISNNNIVTKKEYDFSDLKKESGLHNNLLFSSAKFIYRIDENLNMSITALRPDFIRENINLTLSEMLKKLVFDQNIIHIIFSDEDHAEYNLKQNKIYYYSKNKIPFGESVDDSSKFYFYDKVDRKFYSVSNEYLNPDLFKVIRNENGLLKLEFKNPLIWKFENSGNLKIQSLNNSKKIAFILNDIHNVRKKIHTEECNKIENIKDLKLLNLKKSLCILGNNSNISDKKLVTAFSKQNNQTLIFDDAQSSFRQLDSVTGKIFLQGTVNEYWGVGDWLGNSSPFTDYPKLLAFGELPNQFTRSNSNNSIYLNDIRFIDSEGSILRATSGIKNLNTKNYYVEKKLNKDYVNSIFGAFVFNKDKHTLYFLKNNLKFDELDTNYDIIATGNISDLFHMLPIDDIPKINTIIKLDNYISLFKSDGKKLVGFYLIPIEDLFTDKELNNRFYIKL